MSYEGWVKDSNLPDKYTAIGDAVANGVEYVRVDGRMLRCDDALPPEERLYSVWVRDTIGSLDGWQFITYLGLGDYTPVWPNPAGDVEVRQSGSSYGPNLVRVVPDWDPAGATSDGSDSSYVLTTAWDPATSPQVYLELSPATVPATPAARKFYARGRWRNEKVTSAPYFVTVPPDLSGITYQFYVLSAPFTTGQETVYAEGYVNGASFTADGFVSVTFDLAVPTSPPFGGDVVGTESELDALIAAGGGYLHWFGYPAYNFADDLYWEHSVEWAEVGIRYYT